jgi:hypothetical protein
MFTAVQVRFRQTVVNLDDEQINEALCKVLCHKLMRAGAGDAQTGRRAGF